MNASLLDVRDLQTYFFTESGVARAVDFVNFRLQKAQVIGIVGESGCGKSVTAHSIMRLIPPPGKIVGGQVFFDGRDLLTLSDDEMRDIRGDRISMIFQEPMTSLNPVFRVEDQIVEVLRRHRKIDAVGAHDRALELMKQVGIPSPESRLRDFPHQLSGGMRQRVMIAMAIACGPQLIIADEPTTALDVTIQAQILDLLLQLREELGTAVMLITHDLGVIAEVTEQVLVMYTGRIVEEASVAELFQSPLHPYTQGLMKSIPGKNKEAGRKRLEAIPGLVPSLLDLPKGCKFNTRCKHVFDHCMEEEPGLLLPRGGHPVRCWLYEEK